MPGQPIEQFGWIPHGGRQPDPLRLTPGQPGDAFEHRQQMPATVVTDECVDLIHDHGADVSAKGAVFHLPRNQHRLEGFGSGQQAVGDVAQHPLSPGLLDVPVPQAARASHEPAILFEPRVQVVEQGLERTDVDHAQARPLAGQHPRENREERRFRLPAHRRREQQNMLPGKDRLDAQLLERPQLPPPQRVHNVMLQRGVEPVEAVHSLSSTSSTDDTPAAACSVGLISVAETVNA